MFSFHSIMFPQHSSIIFRLKLSMRGYIFFFRGKERIQRMTARERGVRRMISLLGGGVQGQLYRIYYVNFIMIFNKFPGGEPPLPRICRFIWIFFQYSFRLLYGIQHQRESNSGKFWRRLQYRWSAMLPFYNSAEAYKCQFQLLFKKSTI